MSRQVTSKGLKAIIRHNVVKELKRLNLSETEYNEILQLAEESINKATHDDLKKKGIVKGDHRRNEKT